MKILVVKRDKLGDLLLTTPTFRLIREAIPDAEIHLVASRYSAWVVNDNPDLHRVWSYELVRGWQPRKAWQQLMLYLDLRREKFDVAIAAGGDESPRALSRALHSGAKRVIGYASSSKWRSRLSHALDPPTEGHEALRIAKELAPLGIAAYWPLPAPIFKPNEAMQSFAKQWLAERGLVPGKFVMMGIGARDLVDKPSVEQILRWSQWLNDDHGLSTVFTWTPTVSDDPHYFSDDAIAAPVLAAKRAYLHPYCGPIKETVGLIFAARTSLFPNSGMMHFAAASPGGVIGFFCLGHSLQGPDKWAPLGPRAHYLDEPNAVSAIPDARVLAVLAELI